MAIEIHRSGALDAALDEALATIDGQLKVGDRLQISGTLQIQGVSSDPDGTPLVTGEFSQGTVSAEQVEPSEDEPAPTAQPTSGPSASAAPAAAAPAQEGEAPASTTQTQAETQQESRNIVPGDRMFPEVTRSEVG